MLGVISEQLKGDAFECSPRRVDLGQDVDAVPVLPNHLLDAAHLPLDAPESRLDFLLVLRITWHPPIIPPRGIVVHVNANSVVLHTGGFRFGEEKADIEMATYHRNRSMSHSTPKRQSWLTSGAGSRSVATTAPASPFQSTFAMPWRSRPSTKRWGTRLPRQAPVRIQPTRQRCVLRTR